jgi:hypothetical protein
MRQGILITAYRDIPMLEKLVTYFDEDFEMFIHIDKRCREKLAALEGKEHLHLFRAYAVEWGDYKHLLAIVMLMKEAYRHTDLEYFHLITGSDYPCLSIDSFKASCNEHGNDNYLEHFPLPHVDWGSEGGLNRIQYWWWRPNSTRTNGAWVTRKLVNLQRRLGIKRDFKFFGSKLYGGGTYWSLSREAVGVAVDYLTQHPDYLRRFCHTSIAEEICLPTLLINSNLPIINDYKRYIDWGPDGANPQVLNEKDYDKIVDSGALFARKMERGKSDKLIALLQQL